MACPLVAMSKRGASIRQQMKMLQWQKMQTEANIRSTLVGARSGQEEDIIASLSRDRVAEQASWRKQIVDDELSRPLSQVPSVVRGPSRSRSSLGDTGPDSGRESSASRRVRSIQRLKKKAVDAERARLRHHEYLRKRRDLTDASVSAALTSPDDSGSAASPLPLSPAPCSTPVAVSGAYRAKLEKLNHIESFLRSNHR